MKTSQEVLREWKANSNKQLQHNKFLNKSNNSHRANDIDRSSMMIEWATEDQISKIDSVLKSVARDWSFEGREEREVAYNKILMAFDRYLPLGKSEDATKMDQKGDDVDDSGTEIMGDSLEEDAGNGSEPPRVAVPGSGIFYRSFLATFEPFCVFYMIIHS